MEEISSAKMFGGWQKRFKHQSESCNCEMIFAVYLPPQALAGEICPVLYWLSGLTCTDENFVTKAGAQQFAAEHGIIIVAPDTSPRGDDVADDPEGGWDFGLGAGFYLNATQEPYSKHYHMYDYVVDELPALINENFPVNGKQSISGHSMGGHGALTIGLKNLEKYSAISAFSPIVNPISVPWGQKAFSLYLGSEIEGDEAPESWKQYDACELMQGDIPSSKFTPILIDQGDADSFLGEQLQPEVFKAICEDKAYPFQCHMREGYDHSYYFIASFIGEHMKFHARFLK